MAYVSKSAKELTTSYTDDTAEVGKTMNLVPQNGSVVLRRNRAGIK